MPGYRRGDLFKKRERMMDDWAKFCGSVAKSDEVIAINQRKAVSGNRNHRRRCLHSHGQTNDPAQRPRFAASASISAAS